MKDNPESKQKRTEQGTASSPSASPVSSAPASGSGVMLRWFLSKAVRDAVAMRRHVHRLLCAQKDILPQPAIEGVSTAIGEMQNTLRSGADKTALRNQMESLEKAANKWLKPYPHANWRENVEVLLVAVAVAMAIRTFFLQPFKIPTGSMQPTLYGVVSDNLQSKPDFKIPTGLTRVKEWFQGISYIDEKAKVDGTLDHIGKPVGIKIINFWQTYTIGGVKHTIWFPPDYGSQTLDQRAEIRVGQRFRKGQQVMRFRNKAGDHLFVDRMTYNFRKPKRGEIIVFQTAGIQLLPQDQFYIKRLVALGGERVQIGDDRHLVIDGKRLDSSTPHFELVYSFDPNKPPRESEFSGHVNGMGRMTGYQDLFPNGSTVQQLSPNHYMVMGDNTLNSLDSRTWGEFPAENVIGKSFFIYLPITSRFGVGYR